MTTVEKPLFEDMKNLAEPVKKIEVSSPVFF